MKDRVFEGADVTEAVALAAANLGLKVAELRYVVLEAGSPGGRGLGATPARIAVLLHEGQASEPGAGRGGEAHERSAPRPRPQAAPADPREGLRETLARIAAAGGLDVQVALEDSGEALVVSLSGADGGFFLEPEDRAEVLRATEHLLLRLHGAALQPRSVRVSGPGFRERRDAALVAQARRLAEAVRGDGRARTLPALNSYERRVVHVALQAEPGIATASSGEGADRRLTIAPAEGVPGGPPGE